MQLAFVPPAASPIRRQYLALKHQHPDAILFFQLGDFYETFEDDARRVAEACDVALTSREMGRGERVPMAGVPVHAADAYIARLVERGFHIAICDQMEDSAAAHARPNALVHREVTRVITPGTVIEPSLLSATQATYLAALVLGKERVGLAYADISTGEFACTQIEGPDCNELARAELSRIAAAECLAAGDEALSLLPAQTASTIDPALFSTAQAEHVLCAHFAVATVDALGLAGRALAAMACGAALRYMQRTQPRSSAVVDRIRVYDARGFMILDPSTREHLEVTRSTGGRREGSLLRTLDCTQTPMGARLLGRWLGHPLLDREVIEARLDSVEGLVDSRPLRHQVKTGLAQLPDLERLAGRAAQRVLLPREAVALAAGIGSAAALAVELAAVPETPWLAALVKRIDLPVEIEAAVRDTLSDEATRPFGEGVIRPGRLEELDGLRSQSTHGRDWLLTLERQERERSGVKNLKVGYNRVFGYYLEVSTAVLKQELDYYRKQETGAATVEELLGKLGYQRRQTLTSVERFITPELREHEAKVARAATRMAQLEREVFDQLLDTIAAEAPRLLAAAAALAELDALASLAEVADERGYARPEILDHPESEIVGGRHPMVEVSLGWDAYIPGDLHLRARCGSPDEGGATPVDRSAPGSVMLLTGPNMAGKTTYGRMVLLVTLLAQCGSFVPAKRARIGLADRLFLRSGAGDDISGGRSTFMVEMTETAAILRHATPRSVTFFDEVGRGTSTYDGMAIARAIVEYLAHPSRGCRTIFSTHYHELAAIEQDEPSARNFRMEVRELADRVVFTYRVEPGAADRSYGVHVAALAGLPPEVVRRAGAVLAELERQPTPSAPPRRRSRSTPASSPLFAELAALQVDALTPLEALNTLARLNTRAVQELGQGAERET